MLNVNLYLSHKKISNMLVHGLESIFKVILSLNLRSTAWPWILILLDNQYTTFYSYNRRKTLYRIEIVVPTEK